MAERDLIRVLSVPYYFNNKNNIFASFRLISWIKTDMTFFLFLFYDNSKSRFRQFSLTYSLMFPFHQKKNI